MCQKGDLLHVYQIFDALNGSLMTREYVEKALAHGVRTAHITINNFSTIRPYPTLREALSELAAVRRHYTGLRDVVKVVERASDFDAADDDGKLRIVFGYQNVPGIESDLRMLELFEALGVRCIQISHNRRGSYAGGCADEIDEGLTPLGRELISELNRLRIVVDLSHTGEQSTLQAIGLSSGPVCITHANAFAVCPNARNKSDAVLIALGRRGGVIGLCYLTPLVRMDGQAPTSGDFLAHLEHVRDRIGIEHIGLGSDFIEGQPAERYEEFLRNPQVYGTWPWRFPITDLAHQQSFLAALRDEGFEDSNIRALASENFVRVFKAIIQ